MIEGVPALTADIDALIAAGRCDLVALDRPLVIDPGFVQRAAEAIGWDGDGDRDDRGRGAGRHDA